VDDTTPSRPCKRRLVASRILGGLEDRLGAVHVDAAVAVPSDCERGRTVSIVASEGDASAEENVGVARLEEAVEVAHSRLMLLCVAMCSSTGAEQLACKKSSTWSARRRKPTSSLLT
jgi:hypothetical protein